MRLSRRLLNTWSGKKGFYISSIVNMIGKEVAEEGMSMTENGELDKDLNELLAKATNQVGAAEILAIKEKFELFLKLKDAYTTFISPQVITKASFETRWIGGEGELANLE